MFDFAIFVYFRLFCSIGKNVEELVLHFSRFLHAQMPLPI